MAGRDTGTSNDGLIGRLLRATEEAQRAFVNGDFGLYAQLFDHGEAVSLTGPFGGPTLKGWTVIAPRMAAAAGLFAEGRNTSIELEAAYRAGDLAILVTRELKEVRKRGDADFAFWNLRVTQVWRRREGAWRILHRHADPLVERQGTKASPSSPAERPA